MRRRNAGTDEEPTDMSSAEPRDRAPTVVVQARFNGPTSSGNGGYAAGLVAERLTGHPSSPQRCPTVEVTLRRPPPLDAPLRVVEVSRGLALVRCEEVVAEGRRVAEELPTVEAVAREGAREAALGYPGLRSHPFPRCFSCGVDREEGDGLRIFPGPVGDGRVAAPWLPHESLAVISDLLDPGVARVGVPTTWAALDCVGGWASDLEGRPMVLGTMAARVDALPVVGEPHVVVGVELGTEGRKTFTASTLYDGDGRVVARARHVWVAVDPAHFS
jgi:hypothetical protein